MELEIPNVNRDELTYLLLKQDKQTPKSHELVYPGQNKY